jgi:hypothetical protein
MGAEGMDMDSERREAALREMSVVLEKQLEIVIANQRLLLVMHDTLARLLPKYGTEVASALASPQASKTEQQDGNRAWEAFARKTLLALRE